MLVQVEDVISLKMVVDLTGDNMEIILQSMHGL